MTTTTLEPDVATTPIFVPDTAEEIARPCDNPVCPMGPGEAEWVVRALPCQHVALVFLCGPCHDQLARSLAAAPPGSVLCSECPTDVVVTILSITRVR